MRTETFLDPFVGGEQLSAEVMRQQYKTDEETSNHVSHDNLQESKIGVISQAGDADDGQRAGLCGNDRERNCPPGDVASGKKVVAQCALALAKAHAEQRDADQVNSNEREIDGVQAHV